MLTGFTKKVYWLQYREERLYKKLTSLPIENKSCHKHAINLLKRLQIIKLDQMSLIVSTFGSNDSFMTESWEPKDVNHS